jgi:hypothetical protein
MKIENTLTTKNDGTKGRQKRRVCVWEVHIPEGGANWVRVQPQELIGKTGKLEAQSS